MTALSVAAPVLLGLAAVSVRWVMRRTHPKVAAWILVVLLVLASLAAMAWMVVLSGAVLVQEIAPAAGGPAAVRFLRGHGPVPGWTGLVAASLLALGIGRFVLVWHSFRAERRAFAGDDGLLVITTDDDIVGLAVPGRRSRIVLSTGLLRALPADELGVVVAHEQAHLSRNHHRFSIAASLAAGSCPWLRPAASELTFSLERWADEESARAVGDRALVARAITRAALASSRPTASLSFGPHHVRRRVDAMLEAAPDEVSPLESIALAGTGAAATGLAGSAMQLHHALGFLG